MIRRLGGRRWQRLHRLIYPAAIAGVMHYWMLVKSDIRLPAYYGLVVAILLGVRLYWARMQDGRGTKAEGLRTSTIPKRNLLSARPR
jgi:sulfoxide reductase heme-binding subunit YedZ